MHHFFKGPKMSLFVFSMGGFYPEGEYPVYGVFVKCVSKFQVDLQVSTNA